MVIRRKACKLCKRRIYGPAVDGVCLQCRNEDIERARMVAELSVDRALTPRVLRPGEVLSEARMHVETGMRGADRLGEAPRETLSLGFARKWDAARKIGRLPGNSRWGR